MIVPIEINTSDISAQFDVSDSQLQSMMSGIVKNLALLYVEKLEQLAIDNLRSNSTRYIQNVRVIESGKLEATVLLDYSKDKLVKSLEEGQGPYDMKPGLLSGQNAKVGDNGKKYNTVPISHKSSDIPRQLHSILKGKLGKEQVTKSDISSIGLGTSKRPMSMNSQTNQLFREYQHKSSIYQGLSRVEDAVTGQSTYMSFRRISDNSDVSSFIHPGFKKFDLFPRALQQLDIASEVGRLIDVELSKLGF